MKKLISLVLSVAMVISVCSMPSYAIGYNKIVDNDLGGKTTYVGSEHLEESKIYTWIDTIFILGRVIYWSGFQLL